jgi:hypothetical protein
MWRNLPPLYTTWPIVAADRFLNGQRWERGRAYHPLAANAAVSSASRSSTVIGRGRA